MIESDAPLLILTARWPAPSETFILRDLVALRRAGMPFQLVALAGRPGTVIDGIEAEVLNTLDDEAPGQSRQNRKQGPAWLKEAGRSLRHQTTIRQLRNLVTSRGIRHLHAVHLDLPGWLASRVARATNCSFSLEGHARDVYCSNFGLAAICRGASHVTVCNEAARQALAKRLGDGPPPLLVRHILPVDDAFAPPARRQFDGPLRIVFAGRLVAKKGPFEAIEIAALLAKSLPTRVELTMIGDGAYDTPLREAARAKGLAVEFTGWLNHAAVINHFRDKADLLLLPARVADDGDRDGIPNVILEAMANHLPVVAATVGGIPEVLTDDTGWSFPEGSLESAVAAIQSLVANPQETQRRCLAARQWIAAKFGPDVTTATRIRLLQDALNATTP